MTDNEKELVATIKLSLLRAIVDLNEETLAMAIKVPKSEEPSDDCVSRQAVLERINDWWGITSTSGEPTLCDCIRELPPVTPAQRWIPVSERLPESSGVYVVSRWFSDGEESAILTDANYYDGNGYWYDDNRINWGRDLTTNRIVAWMPLPEPYKAEMESEE